MTQKRELEIKLIDKSIKAIEITLKDLKASHIDQAINMYNTVLKAFDTLQKLYESYQGKDATIPESIKEMEQSHRKIIKNFEKGDIDYLIKNIDIEINAQYMELRQLVLEYQYYEKLGINTKDKYLKMHKESGLLKNINHEGIGHLQQYWLKNFGRKIDPSLHIVYENLTGYSEPRIIPQHVIWHNIIPYLNSEYMMKFYSDKNVYDLLFSSENQPEVILKRVNGQYFDCNSLTISRGRAFKEFFEIKEDVIVKESLSDDGKGIGQLKYRNYSHYYDENKFTLRDVEKVWGKNFLIQKVIKQHPVMAEPHKYSVNTIRMITLRWNGSIHYLMSFARFGVEYSIKDNAGQGGVCVGVLRDGTFQSSGIGANSKIYYKHPTTGFSFGKLGRIPNFNKFIEFVKKLHDRILHQNYISWDIAVDPQGEPVFIEMNFYGAAWLYQLACRQPLFGEFTEEILQEVKNHYVDKKSKV